MGTVPTIVVLAVAAAIFALALFQHRRPRELGEVTLIPYGGIQFVALVVAVLMAAHLVSLMTGTPLIGRFSGGSL